MKKLLTLTTGLLGLGAMLCLGSAAQAAPGANGWQSAYSYTVPTGLAGQFFHYACPTGFAVQSGGFLTNSTTQGNGFVLSGSGPRLDLSPPNYNEYGWSFRWDNGGAPAGSVITFNILCKRGNP